MKKIAVAVLILATLCSFAAAESRYILTGLTPTVRSESRIPDPFDLLGVEAVYVESFQDEEMDTFDVYAYPCSGAINAPLLFADYAEYAAYAGCEVVLVEDEYVSFVKDDMFFLLGVYEHEPETVYLAADECLTIGGV